jgi:hypothetical protein
MLLEANKLRIHPPARSFHNCTKTRALQVMKIGGSDAEEDSSVIICTLNPGGHCNSTDCVTATHPSGPTMFLFCPATHLTGRLDSVPLDLFLDKYAEFELQGANTEVHLTGGFKKPSKSSWLLW